MTFKPKAYICDKKKNNQEVNPYTKTDAVLTNSEKRLSKWMTKTELGIKETKKKCKPQYVVINKGIKFGSDNVLYYSEDGTLKLIISSKQLCYKVGNLLEYKTTAPTREEFINILNEALPENIYIKKGEYRGSSFLHIYGRYNDLTLHALKSLGSETDTIPKLTLVDAFLDLYDQDIWPCVLSIEIEVFPVGKGCVFHLNGDTIIADTYKGLPTRSKHWDINEDGTIICVTPPTELRYYLKWKLDRRYKILNYEDNWIFNEYIDTLKEVFGDDITRGGLFAKYALPYKGTSSLHTIYSRTCPDNKFIVRKVYLNKHFGRWSTATKVEQKMAPIIGLRGTNAL